MIGLILVVLFFVIFFLGTLPLLLLLLLLRLFRPKLAAAIGQPIVSVAFRIILLPAISKVTVVGRENIPKKTAVLFAGNHSSYMDIPTAFWGIPFTHLTGYIAKTEIKKVPFLNWWMMVLQCPFLNRTDPREGLKTIKMACERVQEGWSMFIMPEGTRNQSGELLPFKPGSLKIAERTRCPIVPVAILGTAHLYEEQSRIRRGPVWIHFGEPIETASLSREELSALPARIREQISQMLAEDRPLFEAQTK